MRIETPFFRERILCSYWQSSECQVIGKWRNQSLTLRVMKDVGMCREWRISFYPLFLYLTTKNRSFWSAGFGIAKRKAWRYPWAMAYQLPAKSQSHHIRDKFSLTLQSSQRKFCGYENKKHEIVLKQLQRVSLLARIDLQLLYREEHNAFSNSVYSIFSLPFFIFHYISHLY